MTQAVKRALIFIGPQGCGKATQSQILREREGWVHIDTGGYLRTFAKKEGNDPLVAHVRDYVHQGLLLEDEVVCNVFERALEEKAPNADMIILDGIPRKMVQAGIILDILKARGFTDIVTINLVIPHEESFIRLKKRATIEGRPDDADETKILRRLALYDQETIPVLDFLRSKGVPVHMVDGVGPVPEIAERIRQALLKQ